MLDAYPRRRRLEKRIGRRAGGKEMTAMAPISRGFRGRRRDLAGAEDRVPPGQYVTNDFPVLSAGPTPHTRLDQWTFSIRQGGDTTRSWNWQEMRAPPSGTITADIHCVTRWSKLDTQWQGVCDGPHPGRSWPYP